MNLKTLCLLAAAAFGALAAGIFLLQRRAKTCAVHSHAAGQAALALGIFCALLAVALAAGSVWI